MEDVLVGEVFPDAPLDLAFCVLAQAHTVRTERGISIGHVIDLNIINQLVELGVVRLEKELEELEAWEQPDDWWKE